MHMCSFLPSAMLGLTERVHLHKRLCSSIVILYLLTYTFACSHTCMHTTYQVYVFIDAYMNTYKQNILTNRMQCLGNESMCALAATSSTTAYILVHAHMQNSMPKQMEQGRTCTDLLYHCIYTYTRIHTDCNTQANGASVHMHRPLVPLNNTRVGWLRLVGSLKL